mmetsp:Transcript_31540/g.48386  ORF Transcript_31540/g.48386 Transcript_31540/m.48386 type:complete len:590 (-) Transcript_31540:12-1781(-)|eukprot:CAMPEP_0195281754 /NCGR_PEP_ID=MMETSP0707-20130614/933_1 /TAXON_ID=33640 /ORGANISM="Asterionellopsis glacialis, Strain CCMP134" /LENGTH=589 /DNA_ID=CAMNT_0040340671 /DNA_START=115 /DNA_END=1884 /DNA_ORIENTATION=-
MNNKLTFLIACLALFAGFSAINLFKFTSSLTTQPQHQDGAPLPDFTTSAASKSKKEIARLKNELQQLSENYRKLETRLEGMENIKEQRKVEDSGDDDGNDDGAGDDDDDEEEEEGSAPSAEEEFVENTSNAPSQTEKMNIVLLYADDWTYKSLGAMGNKFIKTPHIDNIAAHGMLFTHNCVTTAICWISRATLFTGQYVSKHQCPMPEDVGMYAHWEDSLYGRLARNGYYNGFFGKWHHSYENFPQWSFSETSFYHGSHWLDDKTHVTQKNMQDGVNFLRKRPRDKPFSLTVSFFATHAEDGNPKQYLPQKSSMRLYKDDVVPIPPHANVGANNTKFWDLNPPFFTDNNEGRKRWHWRFDTYDKYQKMMKNYYRMATEVDAACGRIIRELKDQNVLNNTLIIFTTDNGNFHAEHGLADKWYPHEESIRVPLVVYDPRMPDSKRGGNNDDFTLNIDLAPTMLKAAGVEPPESMQGQDFADLYLKENTPWRKEFYYEWPDPFKQPTWIPAAEALVRKDYKYIYWPQHKYHQIYDMVNDPLELHDLRNDSSVSDVFSEMKSRFLVLKAEAAGIPTNSTLQKKAKKLKKAQKS